MNSVNRLLAALSFLICSAVIAHASTLQAKVVEVKTGGTLIVSNINRSVKVRLKSVAPPEVGQPFADTARDHLKALVLDQTVTVDYTHFADGYLDAKVFLNGIDIGSQMLRDGVAWYDHASDYDLNQTDRDLYAQCEQAARVEKRGLWNDVSPVAPWEFRRIQQAKLDQMVQGSSSLRSKARFGGEKATLSNSDLMGALMSGSTSSSGLQGLRPIVQNGSFNRWTSFESSNAHFSVMIPSNAIEGTSITPDKNGSPIPFQILAAGGERAFLVLVCGKGPNQNYTDSRAIDETLRGLIGGMNLGISRHLNAADEIISANRVRDLNFAGFAGRQYNLTSNLLSGTARIFTKRIGDERQVFVLYALTLPGGEGVSSQFLNSFKITQ
ncbi:MAG TPA: thermonuclease family protein [Pyrinomonadaceae bacterium]|nr:thermonuclease family protein [Pyrinomonadaceae bacterium]